MNHIHLDEPAETTDLFHDPVCGMSVTSETAAGLEEWDGATYGFCSDYCHQTFLADPEKIVAMAKATYPYLFGESLDQGDHASPSHYQHDEQLQAPATAPAAVIKPEAWTCPMHPDIMEDKPGSCPLCGMALEPLHVKAGEDDDPELAKVARRFAISAALTAPLFIMTMGEMFAGGQLFSWVGGKMGQWIQLLLATPVVIWGGQPFFQRGYASVVRRSANMYTLIALGTGVSFTYSLVALILPGIFPAAFVSGEGVVAVYFEAAAVIVTLVLLGEYLELSARQRTGEAVKALLDLSPPNAIIVNRDGSESTVPLEAVRVGDRLRVKPGDKVPVDGIVESGSTAIDESMVTGESMPVVKKKGDPITGGTVNGNGIFIMVTEKVGSETLLARIIDMVGQAQRSRAPIQSMADKVAAYFVPAVVAISVVTFIIWAAFGPPPSMAYALVNAVAVLIIACPCALGLATPISVMVGVGRGALKAVLIRDAEALELMEQVDTLVVDKTGTLTEGNPVVTVIEGAPGYSPEDVLVLAASLEKGSEHPLAVAILNHANDKKLTIPEASRFEYVPGVGLKGRVMSEAVLVGNSSMMDSYNIDLAALAGSAAHHRQSGATVVFVASHGQLTGIIGIADRVKDSTPAAIKRLQEAGLRVIMLTGDHECSARAVAEQLGIDDVVAGVMPDGKADAVLKLQNEGAVVAMAGDGVNDAPALASAHVGIAMGTGTDVAMESAGITLVKGDLHGIVKARHLSQAVMRNIKQNLWWAFGYNSLGVPLAAGILYPFFGILLSPMIAAAAMSFSRVSVITNALRLRRTAL